MNALDGAPGVMVVDAAGDKSRRAWMVRTAKISDVQPIEGIAFVGADDAEQARARALELFAAHPAYRFGLSLDNATIEAAPDNATIGDFLAFMLAHPGDWRTRAQVIRLDADQGRPN